MMPTCNAVEPNIGTSFSSLRDLDRHLTAAGLKKHDRAHMLINACLAEGFDEGGRILGVLARLGFDKRHVAIILKAGTQRQPEWPNWGRHDNGKYYAPPEAF